MNEKTLRKASREELLQLLIDSVKEKEQLLEKMEAMQREVEDANARMQEFNVVMQEAGSVADAAAQVSNLLGAAQKTADLYLGKIRQRQAEQEAILQRKQEESERLASEMIAKAEQKCAEMERETHRRCEELYRIAEQEAGRRWTELGDRLQKLDETSSRVEELLQARAKGRWRI